MDLYQCNKCKNDFAVKKDLDPDITPCCSSYSFQFVKEIVVRKEKIKRPMAINRK